MPAAQRLALPALPGLAGLLDLPGLDRRADPDRLAAIRHERKPNSRYASFAQCEFEVREVESLFRRENINYINSTHFSVEEISAKILVEKGVERRLK